MMVSISFARQLVSWFIAGVLFSSLAVADQGEERPTMWGQELGQYLKDFDEEVLWSDRGRSETYRLSIDAGIVFRHTVIRLDRLSDDRWLITTKHKYRNRWRTWTRRLKTSAVQELVTMLNSSEFGSIPANFMFVDPNEKEGELSSVCIDGAYWVLEAKIQNRYHGAGAQMCGADSFFVPAGELLIKLSGRDISPTR